MYVSADTDSHGDRSVIYKIDSYDTDEMLETKQYVMTIIRSWTRT